MNQFHLPYEITLCYFPNIGNYLIRCFAPRAMRFLYVFNVGGNQLRIIVRIIFKENSSTELS